MTYKGQEIAATFVAGADLGRADFTSIQAAIDALPAAGGEIFLREGTHSLSATVTLPNKPVKIRGCGPATVIDLGLNAIAAFTLPNDQRYVFEDFNMVGNGLAAQTAFLFTHITGGLAFVRNVHVNLANTAGKGIRKGIEETGGGDYIVHVMDSRWFLSPLAASRLIDAPGLGAITAKVTQAKLAVTSGSTGGGFSAGVLLEAVGSEFTIGAQTAVDFVKATQCAFDAALAPALAGSQLQNCAFSGASTARWLDFVAAASDNLIVGCSFGAATSEAIRLASTGNLVADNTGCKVTENGTGQANRYSGNTGFAGSTFGTTSTSSALGQDIGCRVFHAANQSIPNNAVTILAFNSERYDTDVMHDTVTNNSRITVNKAGKYLVTANVQFDINATGRRLIGVVLNGTTEFARHAVGPSPADVTALHISTIRNLAKGDFLEVQVFQTSGAALNVTSVAQISPEFSAQLVG